MDVSVADIADLVDGTVIAGDAATRITGVSSLGEAGSGDITFLATDRYLNYLAESRASAVLVRAHQDCDLTQIQVADPDVAFARVVETYAAPPKDRFTGIHPTAVIGSGSRIGDNVAIGAYAVIGEDAEIEDGTVIYPHVFVGRGCRVGRDCLIYPHVSIREQCHLGAHVTIHSGVIIGSDGFGYASVQGVHHKIPQIGRVVIEDDVEIGANSTIDRARFGVTRIGKGTKIDNLVMIAHNVDIGEHCIIVSQVGIAGSAHLGNHVTVAGQAGLSGHLTIGDRAIVSARAGVTKNIPADAVVMGFPAQDVKVHKNREIALRHLPEALSTVKILEERIRALEARLEGEAP